MSITRLDQIEWYVDSNARQRAEPGICHSYMASLATALNYLNGELDPAWLMGSSAFAFRIFVKQSAKMQRKGVLVPLLCCLMSAGFLLAQTTTGEDAARLSAPYLPIILNADQKHEADVSRTYPGLCSKPWFRRLLGSHAESDDSFFEQVSPPNRSTFNSAIALSGTERPSNGVRQVWARHYSSENAPGQEWASDLAVDRGGNVYITGSSLNTPYENDYLTAKYDPSGNLLWIAYYDGTGNGDDFATAISVDMEGNVYVTGQSYGASEFNEDYVTIKYNSDGVEQWLVRYDGPGHTSDRLVALVLDKIGNVYVTGRSPAVVGEYDDYLTVKYDASGNEQWTARYDGSGNSRDEANDLIVDASGNIYVTGESMGEGPGADFLTVKYDAGGRQVWEARYNSGENNRDIAVQIALDDADDLYLIGSTRDGSGNNADYTTIKYNSNGVRQWVRHYDGSGSWDYATALVVGDNQNVYITGASEGLGTGYDCATIKYSSNGIEQWVSRYNKEGNSNDSPVDVAFDGLGNVYVAGTTEVAGSGSDYVAIKYDGEGVQQWVVRYDGPANGSDEATAMAVDGLRNLYVTGQSEGAASGIDYLTVKYNSAGKEEWVASYDGPIMGSDVPVAIALDAQSNVYVTGRSVDVDEEDGTPYNNDDYATIKYNSEGREEWVARYDGPARRWDRAVDVAVDGSGNVYVTGGSEAIVDEYYSVSDMTTIRYNPDGRIEWVRRYNGPANSNDFASALVLDSKGEVYVTGESYGEEADIVTIKYDKNGSEAWAARYDGPGISFDRPLDLSVDGKGNIYVTGIHATASATEFVTIKYDASGEQVWVQSNNGTGEGNAWPAELTVDGLGNVYVTGCTFSLDTGQDFYTVKYDPDGRVQWQAT